MATTGGATGRDANINIIRIALMDCRVAEQSVYQQLGKKVSERLRVKYRRWLLMFSSVGVEP